MSANQPPPPTPQPTRDRLRRDRTASTAYEDTYLERGQKVIIGMDEAGYGAWAGPVVAAAVCLPLHDEHLTEVLHGVKDSKQMTRRQREAASEVILHYVTAYGIGRAAPDYIAEKGLAAALSKAYSDAYEGCCAAMIAAPEVVLIDGTSAWREFTPDEIAVDRIPKGDTLSLSIAAASVLAKVRRDAIMRDVAKAYPDYGFDRHVGYGTAAHRAALEAHGVIEEIHRRNYKPIAELLD